MLDLYKEIGIKLSERPIENRYQELVSFNISKTFHNTSDIFTSGKNFFTDVCNEELLDRKYEEKYFYSFLENQLFHRLVEIKTYSNVNITDTRRFIAVSHDCISLIQILVRENIELNVYFRSSDFSNALQCDLEFISRLPTELSIHLWKMLNDNRYSEISDEYMEEFNDKPVKLNLYFGSLHRYL